MLLEMEDFRSFIDAILELVDLHVIGSLFTWCSPDGKAKSSWIDLL